MGGDGDAWSRVLTAEARTRGVAPEVSAQRSGAVNGGGGPQAPPTRTRQSAQASLTRISFRPTRISFRPTRLLFRRAV
jgi:hypothetical protein